MKAEQCLKHFYLYRKHPGLRDKLSKDKQFIFKRGTDIGVFAQQLFPGGTDVTKGEKWNQEQFAQNTKRLIEEGVQTIYEATFIHDGLLVMVDILHKQDDQWVAYEVKSALKITETYVKDACFQYYVIKNCLPHLVDFNLLTLNTNYVLEGDVVMEQLFKTTSVLKDALKNEAYFAHQTRLAKLTLEQHKIPNIKVGPHCFQPYDCDFLGLCWKNINDPSSVFSMGKLSKQAMLELYHHNIKRIDEIDENTITKKELKIQVKAAKEQREQMDKEDIQRFLSHIKEPYCSLDIEAWMPAIPHYQGTKPFQQIPFLFSMVYEQDGERKTFSYFKPIEEDARKEFLETILESTQTFQTIFMFDKSLEELVLNQLAELFPDVKEDVSALKRKIVDLAEPIRRGNFYHPDMKGNFTLKSIAPLVNESLSFNQLEVQSGISAMYTYEGLLTETNTMEKETIKAQLVDYCEMDARITYQLFNYFTQKLNES